MHKAAAAQAPAQGALFETAPADVLDQAARDLDQWEQADIRMACVLDAEYPSNLRMIHQHPPVLFLRGTPDNRDATSVAVVGTRQPTPRGIDQARQLAAGLAAHAVPVISGLAAGIDTAAHTAALEAGGRTVAVVGTGIDRAYPPQSAALQDEIAAKGLLISQFLPGSPPTKASFPMRNAVMSGYTLATVVVEAAARSGSRMQARLALQHGRHVFLVRSLLEHEWARDYAGRPGVTVVLLIDDTWTTGGRAQSAAISLHDAGAVRVAVVVLGRHFDRDFGSGETYYQQAKTRKFTWDRCCLDDT